MTYSKTSKINPENLEIELDEKQFVKYCNFVNEPQENILNKCVVINTWNPTSNTPICELSSYKNQKHVFGIVSKIDGMNLFCNSNMVWVLLEDDLPLKTGTLLTTYCIGGVLQKQEDDIVHSHTIAKTMIEYEKSVPTNHYTVEGYDSNNELINVPIVQGNNVKSSDFPQMMYWNIEMNKRATITEYLKENMPKIRMSKAKVEPVTSRLTKSTATTLKRTNSNISLASFRQTKNTPKPKTELIHETPIRNIVKIVLLPVHVY
jgi:hypothetical protein